jgi:hypothetical protein
MLLSASASAIKASAKHDVSTGVGALVLNCFPVAGSNLATPAKLNHVRYLS